MSVKPLLTVVIPTKSRYSTLIPVLEAMLRTISSRRIEFIISDNTPANKDILNWLDAHSDDRVRYFHHNGYLSMAQNFRGGLHHVKGEFVIVIGDDDVLHPEIIEILEAVVTDDMHCLSYDRGVYYWSGTEFAYQSRYMGPSKLVVKKNFTDDIVLIDAKEALKDVCEAGMLNLGQLPNLYHGVVRSSLMRKILNHDPCIEPPDMSFAISIALSVEKIHLIGLPLSVPGCSYNSAAGMGRRGEHRATLNDLPTWLPRDFADLWSSDLPKVWNGYTFYNDCGLKTLSHYESSLQINPSPMLVRTVMEKSNDIFLVIKAPAFVQLPVFKRVLVLAEGIFRGLAFRAISFLPAVFSDFIYFWRGTFVNSEVYDGIPDLDTLITTLRKITPK